MPRVHSIEGLQELQQQHGWSNFTLLLLLEQFILNRGLCEQLGGFLAEHGTYGNCDCCGAHLNLFSRCERCKPKDD